MRSTFVTTPAILVLLAACSDRDAQTVDLAIPSDSTDAVSPVPTQPPAVNPNPGSPSPNPISPTPTPVAPPAQSSTTSPTSTVDEADAGETTECIPAEPDVMVVPCTDDINEDRPDLPCSQWVEWGTCEESWMIERNVCNKSCGRCTEDTTMVVGPANSCGGTPNPPMSSMPNTPAPTTPPVDMEGPRLPPVEGGQTGFTTRYWDCCKPHCGWSGNSQRPISSCDQSNNNMGGNFDAASGCNGGPAHMCWSYSPVTNGPNIAYGFAAYNNGACGTCYQLDFTGESKNPKGDGHDLGSQSLRNKAMIVQVINTGSIDGSQFDILVPGGGVGEFNACSSQWGVSNSDLGEQYGGFFLACQKQHNFEYEPSRQCARDWCDRIFSDKPDLHAGCTWFVDWFGLADNPTMRFKEVPCPRELTDISGL